MRYKNAYTSMELKYERCILCLQTDTSVLDTLCELARNSGELCGFHLCVYSALYKRCAECIREYSEKIHNFYKNCLLIFFIAFGVDTFCIKKYQACLTL